MNDPDAALEQELSSLRPRRPSSVLERRIEAELSVEPARQSVVTGRWIAAIAGGVLAVVLFVMAILPRHGERNGATGTNQDVSMPIALDHSHPSVWAYRRAVVDPAVNLDELLDDHRGTNFEHPAAQPSAFSVSNLNEPFWMGEL